MLARQAILASFLRENEYFGGVNNAMDINILSWQGLVIRPHVLVLYAHGNKIHGGIPASIFPTIGQSLGSGIVVRLSARHVFLREKSARAVCHGQ